MTTLKLSDKWDLCLDANGNIDVWTDKPHQIAQDVASACRTFKGECYFAADEGIPYFDEFLGKSLSKSLLVKRLRDRAMTVNNVTDATVSIDSFENRTIKGDIVSTIDTGETVTTSLGGA